MTSISDQDRQRQAREALARANEHSEVVGTSNLERGKNVGADRPDHSAGEDDRVEYWGRRIGRLLGGCFVIYLIYHLAVTYFLT